MPRILLLVILGALASTIAILHVVALAHYFYWTLWWFDILQHFLAGLWIAFFTFWVVFGLRLRAVLLLVNTPSSFLTVALVTTLAVGLAWEVFEYIVQLYFTENYVFDTISDLAMDIVGALTGYIYIVNSRFKVAFGSSKNYTAP